MFAENTNRQTKAEFVTIEDLVPADHLLRKIDAVIDFTFVNEICRPYYCADNGRPAIEPVILFKMLLVGYLFGIRSERRLVSEVSVNVAYRWFLGYGLTDKIPDASVIWQNRRRRFAGTDVAQRIFDGIVSQAISAGLVSGEVLYSDSTHLKANANKRKFTEEQVTASTLHYFEDLDSEVDEDRENRGKKPLDRSGGTPPPKKRWIKKSTTDPESGFMHRDGKPKGFFYLDHRTVDARANIVTDVFVTPGNSNDTGPYIERLKAQKEKFGFPVAAVGLDAGYNTNALCRKLVQLGVKGALGRRRGNHAKGRWGKYRYRYLADLDLYVCPQGCMLAYATTDREGYTVTTGPTRSRVRTAPSTASASRRSRTQRPFTATSGRTTRTPAPPSPARRKGVRSTPDGKRRSSAASPMPRSSMACDTPGCEAWRRSQNSAF